MVITRAGAHAQVAADLTIERVRLSDRGVLRVRAGYTCPVGLAVNPALPPLAIARQETAERPMSQKAYGGIVCDSTRREVRVRFAHPRSPDGAQWRTGVLTHFYLYFQANTDSPYRFVLATDAEDVIP
jgi:hypothetical protein